MALRNRKSIYLKDNPNSRGIRSDYWTKEKVEKSLEYIKDFKGKNLAKKNTYSINVNGKVFPLDYEEMVEILSAMRTCALGNELFISAKQKTDIMFEELPESDY